MHDTPRIEVAITSSAGPQHRPAALRAGYAADGTCDRQRRFA
jgi:hypothetical protein